MVLLAAVLLALACACAAPSAGHAAAQEPGVGHTFIYTPMADRPEPRTVHLAGSFNDWSRTDHPMTRGDDGDWSITLDLPNGVHHYKFVINGEAWLNDPASDPDHEQPDGHGGVNSAVLVGLDVRDLDEPIDNAIEPRAVFHDPRAPADHSVASDDLLVLSVRAQAGDVERAFALIADAVTDSATRRVELPLHRTGDGLDRFRQVIRVFGNTQYQIELVDGDTTLTLPADGGFYRAEMRETIHTPEWAKHAVWYQVFPERFRNGDASNDPDTHWYERLVPWTSDWWDTLPGEARGQHNFYTGEGNVWRRRYGGDLQGLQQQLPYLRELGINALYLNPIFEAESMHKYDTADYRHVDDNFGAKREHPFEGLPGETDDPETWQWSGSDRVFLAFLEEAHRQGFKVILDGVFNHVGTAHPFFQDVLQNGRDSAYADWFDITDWGDPQNWGDPSTYGKPGGIQWAAWDQPNGSLPTFRKDPDLGLAPGPRQHIFDITARWMDPDGDGDPADGIDGWRLDVPGDIPHPFWSAWRQHVKAINPDAYITGEIWQWAHPWLQGDQFDAVMNYRFAEAATDFFIERRNAITPSDFATRLDDLAYSYPLEVAFAQQNLMDSHDTDRLASMFVNPDRPYDGENRLQDNGPDYNRRKPNSEERRRMMQLVAFQMCFVGAPMIYYGSEAGMWGPDDPSNRMPMVWRDLEPYDGAGVEHDRVMHAWYRHAIAVRQALPALRVGQYRTVLTDDDAGVLVFERVLGDRRVVVAVNRSPRTRQVVVELADADEGAAWVDLLSPKVRAVLAEGDPRARPVLDLGDPALESYPIQDGKLDVAVPSYGVSVFVDRASLGD
ncbi:MAG: alpha-amylase family glycosyl hydrolase [Phycisphaerales bacterium JB063]